MKNKINAILLYLTLNYMRKQYIKLINRNEKNQNQFTEYLYGHNMEEGMCHLAYASYSFFVFSIFDQWINYIIDYELHKYSDEDKLNIQISHWITSQDNLSWSGYWAIQAWKLQSDPVACLQYAILPRYNKVNSTCIELLNYIFSINTPPPKYLINEK